MDSQKNKPFSTLNPPTSLTEASDRREKIIEEIKDIDLKLANKNKQSSENKERMDSHTYEEWRSRALYAKRIRERESAFLKKWIRDQRATLFESVVEAEVDNPQSLIQAAYKLLREIQKQEYDFKVGDIALIEMLNKHLMQNDIPTNEK